MATQQRLDEITQQLEDRILERTGKTVNLKPKEYSVSNRLSWAEIVARFEDGEPINEGELLPEVPKEEGITATTFYRATDISPTTFSQMPFSNFKRDIAGARIKERSPVEKEDDEALASHVAGLDQKMNENAFYGDDGEQEDLGVIGYGPDIHPAIGIGSFAPILGTFLAATAKAPQGMTAVIWEGLGGPVSGYEAHATLTTFEEAATAFNKGEITSEQYYGYLTSPTDENLAGGGKFNAEGLQIEGTRWEKGRWETDESGELRLKPSWEHFEEDAPTLESALDAIDSQLERNQKYKDREDSWEDIFGFGDQIGGLDSNIGAIYYDLESEGFAQVSNGWGYTHDGQIVDLETGRYSKYMTAGTEEQHQKNLKARTLFNAYDKAKKDDTLPVTSNKPKEPPPPLQPFPHPVQGTGENQYKLATKDELGRLGRVSWWYDDDTEAPDETDPLGLNWGYGFSRYGLGDDAPEGGPSKGPSVDPDLDSTQDDTSKGFVDTEGDPGTDDGEDYDYGGAMEGWEGGAGEGSGFDALASGGLVGMQEGGDVPLTDDDTMEAEEEEEEEAVATEGEMANLGIVKDEQASPPQRGGQRSVRDDIPREADAGDYILPYETVLIMGLKQLNRYAREAIQLAIKNNIDLGGTDLDPTDDVPIVVSNYEYHIPKVLVPFFGGGKKYLDKIRNEGLALRKRLAEEKKKSAGRPPPPPPSQPAAPSPQQQQQQPAAPAEAAGQEAPPPPPPVAESQIPQEVSMMQKGGFVLDSKERTLPTTEAILEADVSQVQQSAYNQMQALKRSQKQQQQPPMVDPTGKITPQGFAAPQGYQKGAVVEQDRDLAQAAEPKSKPPLPDWANRALDPKTPTIINEDGTESTVKTMMHPMPNGDWIVFPSIRMKGKNLIEHKDQKALSIALDKQDYVRFKNKKKALNWSKNLSEQIGKLRDIQKPPEDIITDLPPPSSLPQEQGFASQPRMP